MIGNRPRHGHRSKVAALARVNKNDRELDVAGDMVSVRIEQCRASRQSYLDPFHTHVCTAPVDALCATDGHVCDCGDWWHD